MKRDNHRGPIDWTLFLETCFSAFRFFPSLLPAALIVAPIGLVLLAVLDGAGVLNDAQSEVAFDRLSVGIAVAAAAIAVLPVLASVLTLTILPGGYGLTRWELDGKQPSTRQRKAIQDALQRILSEAPPGLVGPTKWLVLDRPDPNAFVIGTTIYVHRGLIDSEYLEPILAHELGHLYHGDGRLALARRRLVPPPFSLVSFEGGGCLPILLTLFGGGAGLWLTGPAWNRYWRKREFLADRFAFECGQATALIEFLELNQFYDVAVPFGVFRRDHPHDEERISELLRLLEEEARTPVPVTAQQYEPPPYMVEPVVEPVAERQYAGEPIIGKIRSHKAPEGQDTVGFITEDGNVLDMQHRLVGWANQGGQALTPHGQAGLSWPRFEEVQAEPLPVATLSDCSGQRLGEAHAFPQDRIHIEDLSEEYIGVVSFDFVQSLEVGLMLGGVAGLLLLLDNPERC